MIVYIDVGMCDGSIRVIGVRLSDGMNIGSRVGSSSVWN